MPNPVVDIPIGCIEISVDGMRKIVQELRRRDIKGSVDVPAKLHIYDDGTITLGFDFVLYDQLESATLECANCGNTVSVEEAKREGLKPNYAHDSIRCPKCKMVIRREKNAV